jgi:hypothetical protein
LRRRGRHTVRAKPQKGSIAVNLLLIIVAVIAVVLLVTGGFVQSLNFLIWVGIVLAIIAIIVFLARTITGRRSI